jgi:hypothetical protein
MWIFFIFWHSKFHVSSTGVVSSLFPLQWRLSYGRHHHAAALCHASFSLSQDELIASVSFFNNALSCRLLSQTEIEVFNPHHRHRSPYPDRPTLTLHCCKKVISTLATFPNTQPRLYFVSSLIKTPRHRSSIRRHHSLSPPSHTYHPSAQTTHTVIN